MFAQGQGFEVFAHRQSLEYLQHDKALRCLYGQGFEVLARGQDFKCLLVGKFLSICMG